MKTRAVVGFIIAAPALCINVSNDARALDRVGLAPINRVELAPINRVELAPINRVEVAPINRVELAPIKRVEVAPIMRVEVAPMERVEAGRIKRYHRNINMRTRTSIQTQADQRGKVIDPKGQGLNQAQIDAMERQRQIMWNATGGGMVYR